MLLEWAITSKGNMTSASRCNSHSNTIIGSSQYLMSSPISNVTDEVLTNLKGEISSFGALEQGVTSKGKMTSSSRCNTLTYFILVGASHLL